MDLTPDFLALGVDVRTALLSGRGAEFGFDGAHCPARCLRCAPCLAALGRDLAALVARNPRLSSLVRAFVTSAAPNKE
jgi:hypothetical protein